MINISRDGLISVEVPQRTDSYTPISNRMLIDSVMRGAKEKQFILKDEKHECDRTQNQFKMKFFFTTGHEDDFQLTCLNSYNKTIAARAASGIYADICWNLNMVGSSTFKRKHNSDNDLEAETFVKESFNDFDNVQKRLTTLTRELTFQRMSTREMAQLAGRMFFEEKLINTEQANILKAQIEQPSFDYNMEQTAMLFYNHVTHSLKSTGAIHYLHRHEQLLEIMEDEFSFTL